MASENYIDPFGRVLRTQETCKKFVTVYGISMVKVIEVVYISGSPPISKTMDADLSRPFREVQRMATKHILMPKEIGYKGEGEHIASCHT